MTERTALAGKGDIRTVADGLLPSGQEIAALTSAGRDEVRAAFEALLRIYETQNVRLQLALEQLDKAAHEIELQRTTIADTMSDLAKADAEIERLWAALTEIDWKSKCDIAAEIAQRALEPKP